MTVAASPLGMLQLCGSALANKLAEICAVQGYNDPFKHSMYYDMSPFENGIPITTRSKRGVADECCKKGCSWETLEQYCNPPLPTPSRTDNLQATEEHSMNRIPHDDSAGSAGRLPLRARDQKSDLISKGDIEDPEVLENKIAPVIGTINPSYFANPVILSQRIRKEETSLQETK
ncbi:hypothetical protein Cfor_06970 [Coptotermes formosanus]|uniref:Insulin-like domain-containing protein n=1 Tax=Coptotermes formosanus TaxID=36987 RepID=A0A6L2PYM8_COPFO|nr:hypothetical protein Cfor_06970 [Coptotermes formosanus]